MKKIILSLILIFSFTTPTLANASMPAFWNTGSGQSLAIFEKENQAQKESSDNIEMQSEKVTVMLYQGFSVIKGEYYMYNSSDKEIETIVGYPNNKVFKNEKVKNIVIGDVHKLKVFLDQKEVNLISRKDELYKNWFVWKSKFKPKRITKIEVYFLTDNHNAKISEGYDRSNSNGFTYILESGKVWKDKIKEGNIYIKLMEDVDIDDILGVYPEKLQYDKENKLIIYSFKNLEPSSENNIIIRYKKTNNEFDFEKIKEKSENYFKDIKDLNLSKKGNLENLEKNDFKIPFTSTVGFYLFVFLMGFVGVFFILLYFFIKLLLNKLKKA
ncbi:MAG: hypothetical protein U0457_21285 [Candidatus Sericytochromatia bacterium]